ncbi:MAG: hypothetical protein KF681_16695 [Bdellovibrionaceae bacterium]|nr:hypothetical protein [Pseudobdellovibrionaceae bacterium]
MKSLILMVALFFTSILAQARSLHPEFERHLRPSSGIQRLCDRYEHRGSTRSCFMDFNGEERGVCEYCTEGKSCFMAFNGDARNFCEAYGENKSCFMAFNGEDRGWCEVLKEGKSCFMALNGAAREACERGLIPRRHLFWQK